MYKIKVITRFSAAHSLRNYGGKCEDLHGHNWKVIITVSGKKLSSSGMVMDFNKLKGMVDEILEEFDHQYLNELSFFKKHNPSSEEIARYIFMKLKKEVSKSHCCLKEVKVWETENSCAIYTDDRKTPR